MTNDSRDAQVLLVGSVPLESSEEVMRACGETVGEYVAAIPDGEPGDRIIWINFLALRTYYMHPQLQSVHRPAAIAGVEQWVPASPQDHWQFKIKPGVRELRFDDLRYAGAALSSYRTFRELKRDGVIPAGVRFQVCLPFTWSGTMMFFMDNPDDLERVIPAFERAMINEVEKIALAIPAEELAIQWDVCIEVLDLEGAFPFSPPGDRLERFLSCCRSLTPHVPEGALMGYHLCYADLGHKHILEPKDLAVSVLMANAALDASGHRVDFFHMAVPRDRDDLDYFTPLRGLDIGDARLFLGLIHMTDGAEGAGRRIESARTFVEDFGIATECGFGRRPADQVQPLLDLHAELAEQLPRARVGA